MYKAKGECEFETCTPCATNLVWNELVKHGFFVVWTNDLELLAIYYAWKTAKQKRDVVSRFISGDELAKVKHFLKSDSHLPKKNKLLFASMKTL